jgi:hypothetical protein
MRFPLVYLLPAVLVLTGCASAPDREPTASPDASVIGSAAQRAALSDGRVTRAEYQAAFNRFESCVESAGFAIGKGSEVNQVIRYVIPQAAVASGASSRCYDSEFHGIDAAWQVSREKTSAPSVRD